MGLRIILGNVGQAESGKRSVQHLRRGTKDELAFDVYSQLSWRLPFSNSQTYNAPRVGRRGLMQFNRELGIKCLLLEGGGITNGALLRAGLIDEISLAIFPAVDGAKGAPSVFDSHCDEAGAPAPLRGMTLEGSEVLEDGVVWLRYRLQNG
jgi:riboflavin biosynthesis pyrimidine reductase